jgi:23S rRNA pseudouridine2605 synthase
VRVVFDYEKEYRVLVSRRPDEEQLAAWRRGVVLEDGYHIAPANGKVDVPAGKGAWLRVVMREGRKRQIRETSAQIGLPVVRIIRVRIGSLLLGSLKPREWRYLTSAEVAGLMGQPGKARAVTGKARPRLEKVKPKTRKSAQEPGQPRKAPGRAPGRSSVRGKRK